jgi:beta-acetyl hexosaminidase like
MSPLYLVLGLSLLPHIWVTARRSPIWPQPVTLELGEEILWIDRALTATFYCGGADASDALFRAQPPGTVSYYTDWLKQSVVDGSQLVRRMLYNETASSHTDHPKASIPEQDIVRQAVRQTLAGIHGSGFVPWKFHKRHSTFEPDPRGRYEGLVSLTIKQLICPIRQVDPLSFHGGDEEYSISIRDGTALIESASTIGTLRALGKSYQDNSLTEEEIAGALSG